MIRGPDDDDDGDNDRWEVCVSGTQDGSFEQISYVNSICTSKGGTHVKAVTGRFSTTSTPLTSLLLPRPRRITSSLTRPGCGGV